MLTEEIYSVQRKWAEEALFLMRELLPLMTPVSTFKEWLPAEQGTLGELLSATARSTESVLLLCAYGQLWDAEMVLRSVVEGTLKLARLLQSPETFKVRYEEFANELRDIAFLKDHEKAKALLDALQDPAAAEWEPIRKMILPDENVAELRARYPKTKTRELDRRWGFTGIISDIATADNLFRGLKGLAHGYSISSHLIHADCLGIMLPMEREQRSPEDSEALHLAHLSRLLSDVFTYFLMRLYVGYRYVKQPASSLEECHRKIDELLAPSKEFYNAWMAREYGTAQGNFEQ